MQQLSQVLAAPLARSRGAQFGNRWARSILYINCLILLRKYFLRSKNLKLCFYKDFVLVKLFCRQTSICWFCYSRHAILKIQQTGHTYFTHLTFKKNFFYLLQKFEVVYFLLFLNSKAPCSCL